uniref:Uncharacterized protein n=1 Tax=Anguilla anguilla TaxID=7936 RepID=A0A0E9X9N0_ANGAN
MLAWLLTFSPTKYHFIYFLYLISVKILFPPFCCENKLVPPS